MILENSIVLLHNNTHLDILDKQNQIIKQIIDNGLINIVVH